MRFCISLFCWIIVPWTFIQHLSIFHSMCFVFKVEDLQKLSSFLLCCMMGVITLYLFKKVWYWHDWGTILILAFQKKINIRNKFLQTNDNSTLIILRTCKCIDLFLQMFWILCNISIDIIFQLPKEYKCKVCSTSSSEIFLINMNIYTLHEHNINTLYLSTGGRWQYCP